MSKLLAIFSYVQHPLYVFSPLARSGSCVSAFSIPYVAILSPYGSVALDRAIVDVLGTAPGILPTQ